MGHARVEGGRSSIGCSCSRAGGVTAPSVARRVEQGKAYHDWTVPWWVGPATATWLHQPPAGDPLSRGRCMITSARQTESLSCMWCDPAGWCEYRPVRLSF